MAVLGQVPAQGVDALRRLPYQQVAGPEHNSVRLLCLVLHRHKAHPRPLRRFADRLSIRHIILLPLDEGPYVSGWDQPHRVAQLAQLPRPVVRPATRLQRHKTGRLPREKLEHLGPHQALAEHHPAGRIGPVRLKYPLRNIKPYRASLAHGRLLWGLLNTTLAHRCRRGASTPSRWLLARLHANKAELLMALDRPDIPLHTNSAENAIRCQVTKRKISGGTRSDRGRNCRDAFLGLAKTCAKLGL